MAYATGKYEKKRTASQWRCPYLLLPAAFLLIEVFSFLYLREDGGITGQDLWPLAFGGLWTVMLGGILRVLPRVAARAVFAAAYLGVVVYSVGQTAYYRMFSEMMWMSEFRYASAGADYLDVLANYPVSWFFWVAGLVALGILLVWKYPGYRKPVWPRVAGGVLALSAAVGALTLPQTVFENDQDIRYAGSDYGRMQSAEAAYENMFNPYRLYRVCGIYQTAVKDIYANAIYPMTPGFSRAQEQGERTIDAFFAEKEAAGSNGMTGILEGKNVVLVLMESMDDWMLGQHTPTISRLMEEGITFTNFYTPPYGGIRTFNTEFCVNTGSFLSSAGGYAFDYVTNHYNQSLANLLRQEGYSAMAFHYNDPSFYSRDVFSEAMGYEDYVFYGDYLTEYGEAEKKQLLYDDTLLFTDPELRQVFFRQGEKKLNFVITRSAHLSYKYNEVLSHWGLKKYPEYRGMTGNEETDCALLKARLVDDFFRELLTALEEEGQIENTVIIGVTDHYTYGYKNTPELMTLSGVDEKLLLEKTPCFIWSRDLEPRQVDEVMNTADLLPTILNLMGVETDYDYMGTDAFAEEREGFAPFSDGSWITEGFLYNAVNKKLVSLSEESTGKSPQEISETVQQFTKINNLILETDYYE